MCVSEETSSVMREPQRMVDARSGGRYRHHTNSCSIGVAPTKLRNQLERRPPDACSRRTLRAA